MLPQLWGVCNGAAPAQAQGQLQGSLCGQPWKLQSPGCCWMLPSQAGFLSAVWWKEKAQAKGHGGVGHPKEPAGYGLPEE